MKIVNCKISLICILFFFTISCKKNDVKPLMFLTKENGLSRLSAQLGIKAIGETENNIFSIKANSKVVNNIPFNLNETKLTILTDKNFYHLSLKIKTNENVFFALEKSTKKVYKVVKGNMIELENITNIKDITYFTIAMSLFNDIMTAKETYSKNNKDEQDIINDKQSNLKETFQNSKTSYIDENDAGGCERTIVSIRSGESRAIAYVTAATDDFIKAHPDCKRIYGIDTGCVWGSYICIASQSIKCSGGGCNVGIGTLE